MEHGEEATKLCSKCVKNAASAGHAWCRRCRSDHELTRQATQVEIIAVRNFQAGVRAIRMQLAQQMARCPGHTFEGRSIAEWIMQFPAPERPTE